MSHAAAAAAAAAACDVSVVQRSHPSIDNRCCLSRSVTATQAPVILLLVPMH